MKRLFTKMAVQRCRHNIAQIGVLALAHGEEVGAEADMQRKTIFALLAHINRDLSLIEDGLDLAIDDLG